MPLRQLKGLQMNREIGGYIELAKPVPKLHSGALRLNSGRNCLAYLIEARGIGTVWLPDFLCASVSRVCAREGVAVKTYRINEGFEPNWADLDVLSGEYLYLVDYYGQLTDAIVERASTICGGKLIVDEAMGLFVAPRPGIDTLYSPRKFLGIPDGGYLYTDAHVSRDVAEDESREHMSFLLGRVERPASEYYEDSKANNRRFVDEPVKRMSKLTRALIGAVGIEEVCRIRETNYAALAEALGCFNRLELETSLGPMAYPFLVDDGPAVRSALANEGIYIPTLWPDVLENEEAGAMAKHYARDILPLPCDQRYGYGDMERIVKALQRIGVVSRPLEGKKVAILGGTRITCEIVHAAKKLGMHTTVIDYNPPEKSPAKLISDEHALISVADTKAVAQYLKDNHIDGVTMGYTDSILGMFADICEEAGLPCYGTREQFETFTDKRKWKKLCVEFGVPTAREYDEEILDLPEDEIDFPLFIKPSDGSGARGTSVVRTKGELVDAVEKARGFARNGKVLIEKCLEGPEVTVFWLFAGGRYEVTQIGNRHVKHNQEGVIPLPAGYTFPSAVIPRYLDEVAPRVREVLASQGVQDGMMFMQCIVMEGLPYVYDIGFRLTGSLEHHLTEAIAGYNAMDMHLRHAVTGSMTDDPLIWDKVEAGLRAPCFNVSTLMRPGVLDHFEGLEEVEANPSVVAFVKAHVEGEELPPEAKGELRQIALRTLGRVDDLADMEAAALGIQRAVSILSPEGEDLVLPGLEPEDFAIDNMWEGNCQ